MYDIIVVGSGPSGIMSSIFSAKKGKKVLLLEKNGSLGKKIIASGGGRCNVTNLKGIDELISNYKNGKFLYNALLNFTPKDVIDYFEKELNIRLKEEDNNRIFPESDKSKTIVNALEKELIKYNVQINLNETLESIYKKESYFLIKTNKKEYSCNKLVLAMGGKSYPNLGTTGDAYPILENLGHKITDLYPTQTPLISSDLFISEKILQGVSLENIHVKLNKKKEEGNFIFTHFGVSGSSVFRISEDVYFKLKEKDEVTLEVDFLPKIKIDDLFNYIKIDINFLKLNLPKRLFYFLLTKNNVELSKGNQISNKKLQEVAFNTKNFKIKINALKGFENAFLTAGGVSLKEIDSKTFESKIVKNLFIIGELLDIHAHTGGYNITSCLSMGFAVGKFI